MLYFFLPFTLLTTALVAAQHVLDNLSFGHKQGISPKPFEIPGWSILGESHVPEIMSDRVILTPPHGGGKRGALWSEAKSQTKEWAATLEFRAGGVDNGKGNLQLWYVKDGVHSVGAGSIYMAGKFDGLAVVINTVSGVQKIRGFLNDGSVDHQHHPNVDSLAFGHCDYNYRNLGRPSKLEIKSLSSGLEVLIDGKQCFSTTKVSLPTDYNFGVTAASNEPPDSFEIFKLEVRTASGDSINAAAPGLGQTTMGSMPSSPQSGNYLSSEAQFQDMHHRLDDLYKATENMLNKINSYTEVAEQRHQDVLRQVPSSAAIGSLESRLSNLDRLIADLSAELKGGNHKEQFEKISQQLKEAHEGLTTHLPGKMREYVQNHTPRIGFIVFSFMAFQSCCLAVLLWQKWRKNTMPKKFL